MHASSEKLNPHEIRTLLRGELESIAAGWSDGTRDGSRCIWR